MTTISAAELIRVVVSDAIQEVLQLDDPAMCEAMQLDVDARGVKGRNVAIVGTRCAMRILLEDCRSRGWDDGWDQPSWYARVARAAYAKITEALA